MRLKALTIKNFKGIDERGVRIELAPVTLLFGPNNAGKSTILQALHLARVIICHPKTNINKIDALGNVLNIGSFEDYVHLHDKDRVVKIYLDLSLGNHDAEIEAPNALLDLVAIGIHIYFDKELNEVTYDFACTFPSSQYRFGFKSTELTQSIDRELLAVKHKDAVKALGKLKYVLWLFARAATKFIDMIEFLVKKLASTVSMTRPALKTPLKKLGNFISSSQADGYSFIKAGNFFKKYVRLNKFGNKLIQLGEKLRHIEQLTDLDVKGRYIASINELDEAICDDEENSIFKVKAYKALLIWIQEFLNHIFYIGPLRTIPRRGIAKSSQMQYDDWAEGSAAWDKLHRATEEQIAAINNALHGPGSLEIGYTVRHGNISQKKRLFLHNEHSHIDVEPHDVGTGISQILPVITASVLEPDALVMVAQPELHIHPKVQANLGDILLRASQNNGSMFLLETHSEHLMLRLLRRIRETSECSLPEGAPAATINDVAVNYVQKDANDCTEAVSIAITPDGDFARQWPNGFFAERAEELF